MSRDRDFLFIDGDPLGDPLADANTDRRCDCPAWHPDNDHTEAEHTSCSGYHRCGGCDDCVSAITLNSTEVTR